MDKILAPLLLTTQIGVVGYSLWSGLKDQVNAFSEYHKKGKASEPKSMIDDYENAMLEKEGSIVEQNIITNLITGALQALKGRDETVENILIIDDLDRIDPAHIFRLFKRFCYAFHAR